jgi:hypothetical protein
MACDCRCVNPAAAFAKIRIMSNGLAGGGNVRPRSLKFPENREFNREFLRIRWFFGLAGANSLSHFNALSENSLSARENQEFVRNFNRLHGNSLFLKEQGIFRKEQGIFSMEQGISISRSGFMETIHGAAMREASQGRRNRP